MSAEEKMSEILASYREAKLLEEDIYERNRNVLPDHFLNEIRAMFDHMARCYRDDATPERKNEEMRKAEGHLQRFILDCFKQIITILKDNISRVERETYSSEWLRIDNGDFWKFYISECQKGQAAEIEAKKLESVDKDRALEQYQLSYESYRSIEQMIRNKEPELKHSREFKQKQARLKNVNWFFVKFTIAVITTICSFCIKHFLIG